MDNCYVYIVFSSTGNRIGRLVRWITAEPYNHASIALDEDLSRMYSFARRYYRTPLYGGFVRESLSRYHQNGRPAHICVCRLPVTPEQYAKLDTLLTEMLCNGNHYLYNHLSALMAPFRRRIKAQDAYTCIEFIVQILSDLGTEIDPARFHSICTVLETLKPFIIYSGPAGESVLDENFYAKKPVPYPTLITLRDMLRLLPRLGV